MASPAALAHVDLITAACEALREAAPAASAMLMRHSAATKATVADVRVRPRTRHASHATSSAAASPHVAVDSTCHTAPPGPMPRARAEAVAVKSVTAANGTTASHPAQCKLHRAVVPAQRCGGRNGRRASPDGRCGRAMCWGSIGVKTGIGIDVTVFASTGAAGAGAAAGAAASAGAAITVDAAITAGACTVDAAITVDAATAAGAGTASGAGTAAAAGASGTSPWTGGSTRGGNGDG